MTAAAGGGVPWRLALKRHQMVLQTTDAIYAAVRSRRRRGIAPTAMSDVRQSQYRSQTRRSIRLRPRCCRCWVRRGVKSVMPLVCHFEQTPYSRRVAAAWLIMGKHERNRNIRETGSTIQTPPTEDRATASCNMHRNFGDVWTCRFWDTTQLSAIYLTIVVRFQCSRIGRLLRFFRISKTRLITFLKQRVKESLKVVSKSSVLAPSKRVHTIRVVIAVIQFPAPRVWSILSRCRTYCLSERSRLGRVVLVARSLSLLRLIDAGGASPAICRVTVT